MKKSKYQQYFHCLLFAYYFHMHFGLASSSNYIVIDTVFRGVALIRREVLISMWTPKGTVLIRGQRLFEAQCLLEEIQYMCMNISSLVIRFSYVSDKLLLQTQD